MTALEQRLGLGGSSAIGVASMLGAGVFFVWTPAFERAGSWILASLALAALVATLNACVTAQLAMGHPGSGGIYRFGRHYRGPWVGFLAGWMFLTGKTASVAAISLVAGSYLWPEYSWAIATVAIVLFAALGIVGIRATAWWSVTVAVVVIAGLLVLVTPRLGSASLIPTGPDGTIAGMISAAGLLFFAFAGYARMATLGEEVRHPRRTLPRAILLALTITLAVYAAVALAVLPLLPGAQDADTPLRLLVPPAWSGWVSALAVVAALGSLSSVLAGMSRTALEMARNGDLPSRLRPISTQTKGPLVAEVTVALAGIIAVWLADPAWLLASSGAGVLTYYALGHWSALAQPPGERFLPAALPWTGLALCLLLIVFLPWTALLASAAIAAVGVVWRLVITRARPDRASSL